MQATLPPAAQSQAEPALLPVSRSIERTASRGCGRAPRPGWAVAPERWMRLCGSGNMIGSSWEPCTMKGSSNSGAAALGPLAATDSRLAVLLRSSPRSGIDAEPDSARPTFGSSMRTSSTLATPCTILRLTLSVSNGVLPISELAAARERPALDPLEQLLDVLKPAIAPLRLASVAAVERLGQVVDAAPRAVDREAEIAFALEPANAEHVAEALLEVDIGELQLRLEVGAGRRFGEPERL